MDANVFSACYLAGLASSNATRGDAQLSLLKEAWDVHRRFVAWVDQESDAWIEQKRARERAEEARQARVEAEDAAAKAQRAAENRARFGVGVKTS